MMEHSPTYRSLLIFESIIFIALGFLAIALPGIMTFSIELLIGALFLVGGLVQGYRALTTLQMAGSSLSLLSAVLSLIVGALLLLFPLKGVITLTALLIGFFFVDGVVKLVLGWRMKPLQGWGWVLFSGFMSLILAGLLIGGLPGSAIWGIGLLVGINMIFFGCSLLTLALGMAKDKRD